MSKGAELIRNIVLLLIPFWGTFSFTYVMGFLGSLAEHSKVATLFAGLWWLVGIALALASASPIYLSKHLPLPAKFLLVPIYYAGAALVSFFAGWSGLCVYRGSCA